MSDVLKDKFSNYEVNPPQDAWMNITASLDEAKGFRSLAEKMYPFEVEPPASTWEAISSELLHTPKAPVKNMKGLIRKFSIAAAVVGVILVTSLYFFNPENSGEAVSLAGKPVKPAKVLKPAPIEREVPQPSVHSATPS